MGDEAPPDRLIDEEERQPGKSSRDLPGSLGKASSRGSAHMLLVSPPVAAPSAVARQSPAHPEGVASLSHGIGP
jgi:hypothetical protein